MAKLKSTLAAAKVHHRHMKNGSINKKKHQKFKNTPKGKVALINSSQSKATNGNQKAQKNGGHFQGSPKGDKKHSNGTKASNSAVKSLSSKITPEEEKDDTDSSDEDINEGISIKEEVSAPEDEVDDDDSSDESAEEGNVATILGKSLADETDEDDEEFDADSDAGESVENKGVKMFKGIKNESKMDEDEDEDEESDDDDEDDEDENENTDDKKAPGLAALLGASIADESDDEEFQADEHDSDDDDEVSDADSEESDGELDQSANSSVPESDITGEDDSEDEEDDDDEDEDDSDDTEDSSPDLTALLGKSLVDESDDDDFEGGEESDEDEDMSDESEDENAASIPSASKKSKGDKNQEIDDEDEEENSADDEVNESHDSTELTSDPTPRRLTKEEKEELMKRTIYIGNVPKDTQLATLRQIFRKFGIIDTLRIRGVVPENPKMPYKVATIKKKHHPKVNTVCCFIAYKNVDDATKALSMNGKKLDGNFLRVDFANQDKMRPDKKKSVFLGNLPFTVEDNEIWETFKKCGKIDSVRIIRDRKTGLGRGFGYVNFQSVDGAVLAMDLNGTMIKNRELRIKVNLPGSKKEKRDKKKKLKRSLSAAGDDASPKKIKNNNSEAVQVATHNSVNAQKRTEKKQKRSQGQKQRGSSSASSPEGKYQGQKADAKKKPKQDKTAKKKKQMAAKLLAKPKKPAAN